jgi:hypothetical protein
MQTSGLWRLTGKAPHVGEAQRMRSRQRGEGWVLNKDPGEGWALSQKSPNAAAPSWLLVGSRGRWATSLCS